MMSVQAKKAAGGTSIRSASALASFGAFPRRNRADAVIARIGSDHFSSVGSVTVVVPAVEEKKEHSEPAESQAGRPLQF